MEGSRILSIGRERYHTPNMQRWAFSVRLIHRYLRWRWHFSASTFFCFFLLFNWRFKFSTLFHFISTVRISTRGGSDLACASSGPTASTKREDFFFLFTTCGVCGFVFALFWGSPEYLLRSLSLFGAKKWIDSVFSIWTWGGFNDRGIDTTQRSQH